jgi:hypothetical protein
LELPAETLRLFQGYAEPDPPFLIGRLLEDGDSRDLAWLCRTFPEAELASWLETRGGRQLSIRSRAFWEVVLGKTADGEVSSRSALWPL